MSALWIPPTADKKADRRNQFAAQLDGFRQGMKNVLDYWTDLLKQKDPHLEMVFFPPTAKAPGVVPGRFHIMRHNPGAPPSLFPILADDGGFREPTSRDVTRLDEMDLQNPRVRHARERAERELEAAKEREKQREEEERWAHLKDAYNARFRTSVSMNKSIPWSQNVAGRRRAK